MYDSKRDTASVETSQEGSQHEKLLNDRLQEKRVSASKAKGHSTEIHAVRPENHNSNIIMSKSSGMYQKRTV